MKYFYASPQDPKKRGARRGAAPLLVHSPTLLDLHFVDLLGGGHRSGSRRRREGGGSRGGGGLSGIGRGGSVGDPGGAGLVLVLVVVR